VLDVLEREPLLLPRLLLVEVAVETDGALEQKVDALEHDGPDAHDFTR
jgi:hypothetical protein